MLPLVQELAAETTVNFTTDAVLKLLAVFLLIGINAFFVTAEFSIVSVRRSRISQLVGAGDVQARTVQDLQRSLDRLLSTTQLGITLSSLALGWIGESAIVNLVADWLSVLPLPSPLSQGFSHSLAIVITFLAIAYLQIVLGELCPKSVALIHSEELARVLGAPSLAIARIFNPFIWILNQSTRILLQLFGIDYFGQGWYNQVTSEELQLIITTSSESTGLEAGERQLLQNVFEFGEVATGEVMIPRTSIAAISHTATLKAVLEEVATSGHSRYPVIGESLDDIRGIIHLKELAEPLAQDSQLDRSIEAWIRPARFAQEYMPLNELLVMMQRYRQPMILVVDEFGGTAGLVTIEDVVAEILGDSVEMDSTEEPIVQVLAPHTFLIQAQINLEELNDNLKLNLPLTDEYQTLGGFVLFQLQRIPKVGDVLNYEDCEFTIISMEGPRLHQIQIHRLEPPPQEDEKDVDQSLEGRDGIDRDRSTADD
ncbi:MAG: hemolysin family protein [Leptolyngbyaceae cyanobacterium bins.302]|nr:hemolysin family protein [Leptolyngbyaceae cyanobacterium bins.302]